MKTKEIKRRSIEGVIALISRTFLVQIISFLATLGLTIFLSPEIYGVFFLVSSVVNFLVYFSDIGLAAALIQKKEKLTRSDEVTTFTIQQILVLTLLIILFSLTPYIRQFYSISSAGIYLLWALGISFFLSSLKTIPTILLERHIKFNKLIIPQIAENLVFNLVAVYFAWRGLGITSFTIAVLLRGFVGLILMYIISPWRPGFGISRDSLKSLLKFGLPYQLNTFLAVVKDDGMTIFLARLIGSTGLGYLGWASKWANLPLRIFMDNLTKVIFPAFARLQHDRTHLVSVLETSLKYLMIITLPILIAFGFLAVPLISLIPRYEKWFPALIPLYFYLFNAAWASISTLLTNVLNAIGQIKTTFKLMVMWTVLTWGLMPILAFKFGYLGVSYAVGLIALSSVVVVIIIKKYINFSLLNSLRTPILASLVLSVFLFFTQSFVSSFLKLALVCLSGIIIYIIPIFILEGRQFFVRSLNYFYPKKNV